MSTAAAVRNTSKKQEQAKKTLEIYKKHGVNPFSSFLLLLVQFPIIIALYWVFRDGGLEVDPELLYYFVKIPGDIMRESLGIDLAGKSYILALLAGLTQYIHLSRSQSFKNQTADDENASEQEKMMAKVGSSMKYFMPIMITVFAYIIGAAVALYWVTSNIFMIIQEHFIYKKINSQKDSDDGVIDVPFEKTS